MAKTRVFVSFDYDYDLDLKNFLIGQSKNPGSPFEISDWSIKTASPGWKEEARRRIRASDVIAVICGTNTNTASGVAYELSLAQEEGINYFLLWGRSGQTCRKPSSAKTTDQIYKWTWDNLKALIGGSR